MEPRVNPAFKFILEAARIREEDERRERRHRLFGILAGAAIKIAFLVWSTP